MCAPGSSFQVGSIPYIQGLPSSHQTNGLTHTKVGWKVSLDRQKMKKSAFFQFIQGRACNLRPPVARETVFSTTRELVFSNIFVDYNLVTGSRPSPTAHWEAVVGGLMCLAHSRTVEQGGGRTVFFCTELCTLY